GIRPPQMAVTGSQHQAARACRTAPGRFSGTQLRRHPAPTPSVRSTTANRPQPGPAVIHLDTEHPILHVQPNSAIEQDDFVKLANAVDPHIEATGGLPVSSSKPRPSLDGR